MFFRQPSSCTCSRTSTPVPAHSCCALPPVPTSSLGLGFSARAARVSREGSGSPRSRDSADPCSAGDGRDHSPGSSGIWAGRCLLYSSDHRLGVCCKGTRSPRDRVTAGTVRVLASEGTSPPIGLCHPVHQTYTRRDTATTLQTSPA